MMMANMAIAMLCFLILWRLKKEWFYAPGVHVRHYAIMAFCLPLLCLFYPSFFGAESMSSVSRWHYAIPLLAAMASYGSVSIACLALIARKKLLG